MNLKAAIRRAGFGLGTRAEAWQMLADFTSTGMEHATALQTAAEIFRSRREGSAAHILMEFRWALSRGSIMPAARLYGSETDLLMFSGEGRIAPDAMYRGAARVARSQMTFRKAIWSTIGANLVSLVGLGILYWVLGDRLFPVVRQTVDTAQFPLHVNAMAAVADFVATDWWLLLPAILGLLSLVGLSVGRWKGPGRVTADRFPPWSLYRMQSSLTFLLLLVESGRMGLDITSQWMTDISRMSGPYVRSRIRAIVERSGSSAQGIGAAAMQTGQGWPPTDLAAALAAYSTQDGWIENFSNYLDRWLADAEARTRAAAQVLQFLLFGLIALSLFITVQAIFTLVQLVQVGL